MPGNLIPAFIYIAAPDDLQTSGYVDVVEAAINRVNDEQQVLDAAVAYYMTGWPKQQSAQPDLIEKELSSSFIFMPMVSKSMGPTDEKSGAPRLETEWQYAFDFQGSNAGKPIIIPIQIEPENFDLLRDDASGLTAVGQFLKRIDSAHKKRSTPYPIKNIKSKAALTDFLVKLLTDPQTLQAIQRDNPIQQRTPLDAAPSSWLAAIGFTYNPFLVYNADTDEKLDEYTAFRTDDQDATLFNIQNPSAVACISGMQGMGKTTLRRTAERYINQTKEFLVIRYNTIESFRGYERISVPPYHIRRMVQDGLKALCERILDKDKSIPVSKPVVSDERDKIRARGLLLEYKDKLLPDELNEIATRMGLELDDDLRLTPIPGEALFDVFCRLINIFGFTRPVILVDQLDLVDLNIKDYGKIRDFIEPFIREAHTSLGSKAIFRFFLPEQVVPLLDKALWERIPIYSLVYKQEHLERILDLRVKKASEQDGEFQSFGEIFDGGVESAPLYTGAKGNPRTLIRLCNYVFNSRISRWASDSDIILLEQIDVDAAIRQLELEQQAQEQQEETPSNGVSPAPQISLPLLDQLPTPISIKLQLLKLEEPGHLDSAIKLVDAVLKFSVYSLLSLGCQQKLFIAADTQEIQSKLLERPTYGSRRQLVQWLLKVLPARLEPETSPFLKAFSQLLDQKSAGKRNLDRLQDIIGYRNKVVHPTGVLKKEDRDNIIKHISVIEKDLQILADLELLTMREHTIDPVTRWLSYTAWIHRGNVRIPALRSEKLILQTLTPDHYVILKSGEETLELWPFIRYTPEFPNTDHKDRNELVVFEQKSDNKPPKWFYEFMGAGEEPLNLEDPGIHKFFTENFIMNNN